MYRNIVESFVQISDFIIELVTSVISLRYFRLVANIRSLESGKLLGSRCCKRDFWGSFTSHKTACSLIWRNKQLTFTFSYSCIESTRLCFSQTTSAAYTYCKHPLQVPVVHRHLQYFTNHAFCPSSIYVIRMILNINRDQKHFLLFQLMHTIIKSQKC